MIKKQLITMFFLKQKSLIERKGALKNVYVTCSRAKGCIKLEGYGDSIGDVQKDIESYLKKLEKDAMQEVAYASGMFLNSVGCRREELCYSMVCVVFCFGPTENRGCLTI